MREHLVATAVVVMHPPLRLTRRVLHLWCVYVSMCLSVPPTTTSLSIGPEVGFLHNSRA